ncbi:siderophore-interacting protein [Agrococcus carbonis]|uniref:NADPH-dependent ferric siderophore reductase, contains FAD-binding and SIP domains n=1 Tax=Agrococcus carbonis TaxID=684552 RepID=A0A1H1SQN7_9MICO|nr:siderophore-interacting protein [Agrococcus carbonis]SDS50312.1 NADPH-dependent ferric siderophore reductase, contains FAD-binding and SIP domains [Agrococcus carbonis]
MAGPERVAAVAPKFVELEVLGSQQVSPHVRRVTLGGDEVSAMTPQGYDQWFRFFMRRDGQEQLRVPSSPATWFPQYLAMRESHRPWVRNYTVRDFRLEEGELDIDFVCHEDPGPGAAWAMAAQRGERAVLLDEGLLYNDDGLSGDVLMVGDESALPAIAGICGSLDPEAQGVAIIEVGHRDDIQDVQAPAGLDVRWIERGGAREGDAALEELRGLRLATELGYAYSAGEQALATGARRHLVRDRGIDKQRITFTGYWKLGKAYVS